MATIQVDRSGDLGPALREARIAEGITQSALARLARVGRQWLNAFELGEKPAAPLDMVMRVADALGVRIMLMPIVLTGATVEEAVDLDALLKGLA